MSTREETYATSTVTLELPDDVFSALRRSPEKSGAEFRLAAAVHRYQRGQVSQESIVER
jgi:hypothetical protein